MNPKDLPWQPLDPAAGSVPREIESALGDEDSLSACVVILVDSEIDRDWGAQASLAVSRRWAASGHRVILADACLDRPVLHEAVGIENGEGVSDMVLYGASIPRIAGPVGDGLMLASAGTPVVQVADVLQHVKWDMVIRGCREASATLVFHVSAGTPGVEAMTERADGVVVLAQASTDVDTLLGNKSGPLIAVLGPGNGDAPSIVVEDEAIDVSSAEGLPGLTEEEEEDASPSEALPGLSEEDSSQEEEGEASDTFSMSGLEGTQYDGGDSAEVGLESAELGSGADLDDTEVLDDAEVQDDGDGEVLLSQADDMESGVGLEMDDGAVASAEGAAPGLEGLETGTGYDLEGVPDAVEDPSDQPSFEVEPTAFVDDESSSVGVTSAGDGTHEHGDFGAVDLGVDEPADFGAVDLGVDEPADSGAGAAGELEVATPVLDAPVDLDAQDALAEAGVGAVTTEARPKYRGLARLERRRKRAVLARQILTGVVTILIVGGTGVAAAYFGLVNIPGITPVERVRGYAPAPVELPGPLPETAVMSHVLWVDSWRSIETPLSTAEALRERLPNLLIFVTPLEVGGTPRFALYVGPAYSAVEADALKDPVAVALDRLDPNDWSVREAPYAFFLGEYDTAADAQGRVQALARVSVPAYWLQVAYPDGTTGMRVYGGAFSDEFQASEMGRMLNDADLGEMFLTARRGTMPE